MIGRLVQIVGTALSCVFLSLLLGGCPKDSLPTAAPFEINFTFVSNPNPNLNEEFSVEWDYSPANRIEDQFVELTSLTIDGNIGRKFFGCPPPEFRPQGLPAPSDCGATEELACPNPQNLFTNKCRVFKDIFTGPVIFNLSAKDKLTHEWTRKSITLTLPNSFFRAGIHTSNTGYPDFGLDQTAIKTLDFMKYFAIVNAQDDNLIDGLCVKPFNELFAEGSPFFASSSSAFEKEHFVFRRGCLLPFLDVGFLETPAGQPYQGRTHADAVIFAGTIKIDGFSQNKSIKTKQGAKEIAVLSPSLATVDFGQNRRTTANENVLFIQIDLLHPLGNVIPAAASKVVSNVRLGNIGQGLVMPTFGGEFTDVTPTINQGDVQLFAPQGTDLVGGTSGAIHGAGVAFQITKVNGDSLLPASAQLQDISWEGVPVFLDNRLGPLLGTQ